MEIAFSQQENWLSRNSNYFFYYQTIHFFSMFAFLLTLNIQSSSYFPICGLLHGNRYSVKIVFHCSHAFMAISINNCKHQLGHDTKYYCPVASSIKSNEKRLNNDRSPFSHFQGLPSDCCKLMPPLVVHFSK